jgi:hypothetical protein
VIDVRAIPAGDDTELILPDQAVTKIGIQREILGAKEARQVR